MGIIIILKEKEIQRGAVNITACSVMIAMMVHYPRVVVTMIGSNAKNYLQMLCSASLFAFGDMYGLDSTKMVA